MDQVEKLVHEKQAHSPQVGITPIDINLVKQSIDIMERRNCKKNKVMIFGLNEISESCSAVQEKHVSLWL